MLIDYKTLDMEKFNVLLGKFRKNTWCERENALTYDFECLSIRHYILLNSIKNWTGS